MKSFAKWLLRCHIPVMTWNRSFFHSLYFVHLTLRTCSAWLLRFGWYEPLFRSQCQSIGRRFCMEQLPYLLGSGKICLGNDVRLSGKSSFGFSSRHVDSPVLTIGNGTFLGHNCSINVGKSVTIGSHVLIAGGVRISDFDGHPVDHVDRRKGLTTPSDAVEGVIIGDDVWIGHGAIILKGVRVGDRAIIGARSVVTKDVDSDTIVAGNPSRVVKSLDPPACQSASENAA